jgi:hypothetical protein
VEPGVQTCSKGHWSRDDRNNFLGNDSWIEILMQDELQPENCDSVVWSFILDRVCFIRFHNNASQTS